MHEPTENSLRARISKRLADLPALRPPDRMRARVLAAMGSAKVDPPVGRSGVGVYAAAASFVVIAIALGLVFGYVGIFEGAGAPTVDLSSVGAESVPPRLEANQATSYFALVQESVLLEQALEQLPAQRQLMRGDTATTIAALETQIAAIDEQLSLSAARGPEPEFRHVLWRERVDVMGALVQVRYAQSQAFSY